MRTPLLEARGLVKHLGGRRVVDGVDLVCREGGVLGLLGPNGAGKTTTLRMLYGFLTPDAGSIRFRGREIGRTMRDAKRDIGVCTQEDTFDGDFTVEQNLWVACSYFRPRPAAIRMRYQRTWEGQLTTQIELPHVVWGEILWAALLATTYAAIVSVVLTLCRALGLLQFHLALLPLLLPLAFLAACAFAALGLCCTALVPTIDHMNLPVFLLVLPLGFASGTYFPLPPAVASTLAWANPLYHLAESYRGVLLGGPVATHLLMLVGFVVVMVGVLIPLDMRLLRRRVLGD